MSEKTNGKVFWQTKDGDKRLMISWMARKGETKIPIPPQETKIIPVMRKMDAAEADVEFILQSGTPRNIEFSNKEAAGEAEQKVSQQAKIQEQNTKKAEQKFETVKEESKTVEKPIDTNYSKDFHNPYNFVPAIPRSHINGETNELGDRPPSGHDRYLDDKLSGKLTVKMRVETPLLLPDTARMIYDKPKDHRSFPVRVGADGKPFINPTAVKGMLRSAYEAVTNSRMSVFTKHQDRLAFRSEVEIALSVIPARIEMHKGALHIRKFAEKAPVIIRYRKHWHGEKDKLEHDDNRKAPPVKGRAMKYASSTDIPQHREPVWVKVSKRFKWERGYPTTRVIGTKIDEIRTRTIGATAPTGFQNGWVCVTGANMDKKVYERVFVESARDTHILLTNDHRKMWKEVISNYQDVHRDSLKEREKKRPKQEPNDYLGNKPNQTAFSRHIHTSQDLELEEGTLCYLIEKAGGIKAIIPVMISRQLFEDAPADLLADSLKPAKNISQLSPADRVFGWVGDSVKKDGNYRGQIRFDSVTCNGLLEDGDNGKKVLNSNEETIQKFNDWLPMNILGQPKPQQGRFYVAENKKGDAQTHQRNNEDAGYKKSEGRELRGRKIYPHHAHIESDEFWFQSPATNFTEQGDFWNEEFTNSKSKKYFREYLRPRKDNEQQRDSQNRSLQGWVKPNTEFTFDIHFTNLSAVELGALIWLLSLPVEHFHRFGGGKPFGFGSLKLDLADSEIYEGKELKKRYESLDEVLMAKTEAETCKTKFKEAVQSAYPNSNFLKAFEIACQGFADNLPTHYPRKTKEPNAEGKSFEWFVANSKNDGRKLALPNLTNEIGLPRNPQN